ITNLIRLKRGMSMFKLYGGRANESESESSEEDAEGANAVQPLAVAAEIPALQVMLDENARLEPDIDYDFS
ncbi:hypothetical protein NL526_27645, partial [Klebsiella pneumoniae]|nr:hypothetical protein [Klebsiella pneumoniae]